MVRAGRKASKITLLLMVLLFSCFVIAETVLNSPQNQEVSSRTDKTLNFTTTGNSSQIANISVYGGRGNTDNLLAFYENITNGSTLTYSWQGLPVNINSSGLVLLARFDVNRSDYSGNGNDIRQTSAESSRAVLNKTAGKFAGGYVFDGVDDMAAAINSPSLDTSQGMSVSIWIKPSQSTIDDWMVPIVDKISIGHGNTEGYGIALSTAGQFFFEYGNGTNNQRLYAVPTPNWTANSWYLITATHDNNGTSRLYRNGRLLAENNNAIGMPASTRLLVLGRRQSGTLAYFNGTVDDLAVWNRSITEQEVFELSRLTEGTYNWQTREPNWNSTIWQFEVENNPPSVQLLSPINNSQTSNRYQQLEFEVADNETMNITIYGDGQLISQINNITNNTINYNFTAKPILENSSGLVTLLTFEDNLEDQSGNGNTGYNYGGEFTENGKFGYGYEFDRDRMSIADSPTLDAGTGVTISAWIRPEEDTITGWLRPIVDRMYIGAGRPTGYGLGITSGRLFFEYGNGTANQNTIESVQSSSPWTAGSWHHVAATHNNNGTVKIYRDGEVVATRTNAIGVDDGGQYPLLARRKGSSYTFFTGVMDEFAIWNRSLTDEEIRNVYSLAEGEHNWMIDVTDGDGTTMSEVWEFRVNRTDADGDGMLDLMDTLVGNESSINHSGITNFSMLIDRNRTAGSFAGRREFTLYDGTQPILNFTHNFSQRRINLARVKLNVSNNSVVVNFDGQLQNANKTIYIRDNSFTTLCVKDEELNYATEITANCDGQNETDISTCIGNSNVTFGYITCTDQGDWIKISGLRNSGVSGGQSSSSSGSSSGSSSSSSTSSGRSGISTSTATSSAATLTPPEECIESWSCSAWGSCIAGKQKRSCDDSYKCGTEKLKPEEERSCQTGCQEDWRCTEWSICSVNSVQMRACSDRNACGTSEVKPEEIRDCTKDTHLAGTHSTKKPIVAIAVLLSSLIIATTSIYVYKRRKNPRRQ